MNADPLGLDPDDDELSDAEIGSMRGLHPGMKRGTPQNKKAQSMLDGLISQLKWSLFDAVTAGGGHFIGALRFGGEAGQVGARGGATRVAVRKAAPKLLNPPIVIASKGFQHVIDRHTYSGIAKFANKSKFNVGEDVAALIGQGTQQIMIKQSNGRFARTFNVGRSIGIDRVTGLQTSTMTIITEASGALVTAFPGRP